jgi:putative flippase GtrA
MSVVPPVLVRFIRFGSVGASGVVVNQAALWFAHEHLFAWMSPRMGLNAGLVVAISLATANNYLWNRVWTWRDRQLTRSALGTLTQLGQYCLAVALGSALQVILTNLFVLVLQYLLANLCAIGLASVVNFAINNRWTFRQRSAVEPTLPLGSPP